MKKVGIFGLILVFLVLVPGYSVFGARVVINGVPDWHQPCLIGPPSGPDNGGNPPAGAAKYKAWCVATSAADIMGYWRDVKGKNGVADGTVYFSGMLIGWAPPVPTDWQDDSADASSIPISGNGAHRGAGSDLGWYLNTNDQGDATLPGAGAGETFSGTKTADAQQGLTNYLTAAGYGTAVVSHLACNHQIGWAKIMTELNAGRPLIGHFSHGNFFQSSPGNLYEWEWGMDPNPVDDQTGEDWGQGGGNGLGHAMTIVGYLTAADVGNPWQGLYDVIVVQDNRRHKLNGVNEADNNFFQHYLPFFDVQTGLGVAPWVGYTTIDIPVRVGWNVDIHQGVVGWWANDFHIWGVLESWTVPTLTSNVNFETTGPNGTPPWGIVPGGLYLETFNHLITDNYVVPPARPLPAGAPVITAGGPFYYFEGNWSTITTIPYCHWIHFGLEFKESGCNVGYWLQGIWTQNGQDSLLVNPLYGFDVIDGGGGGGGGGRIRIQNASGIETYPIEMQMMVLHGAEGQIFPLENLNTSFFDNHPEWNSRWVSVPTMLIPSTLIGDGGPDSFFDVYFDMVPGLGPITPEDVLIARQHSTFNEPGSTQPPEFWQYEIHGAVANVNVTQFDMTGTVNSGPVSAHGSLTYGAGSPTPISNDIMFDTPLPGGFDAVYVKSAINTVWCDQGGSSGGTKNCSNIGTVTEGNFHFNRHIVARDGLTIVGNLTLDGDVTTPPPGGNSVATLTISGTCGGPTDFVSASGYQQFLHQVGPGVIQGHYTETLVRSGGGTIELTVDTTWTYTGSGVLPRDEYSVLNQGYMNYNDSTGQFLLRGTGYYLPASGTISGTVYYTPYPIGYLLTSATVNLMKDGSVVQSQVLTFSGDGTDPQPYSFTVTEAGSYDVVIDQNNLTGWYGDTETVMAVLGSTVTANLDLQHALPGDADMDGQCYDSDVDIINGCYGIIDGTAVWCIGDFDGDGNVYDSDVDILNGCYGLGHVE